MAFHLTGGERHDLLGVGPLLARGTLRIGRRGRPRWKPQSVIADRTYSAARLLEALRRRRVVPVIQNRADQPENPASDREIYRERNLVGRLVGKLKQFRRVATRYEKLDPNLLALVQLASGYALSAPRPGIGRTRAERWRPPARHVDETSLRMLMAGPEPYG